MKYKKEEHSANVLSIQTSIAEAKSILKHSDYDNIIVIEQDKFLGIVNIDELSNEDQNLILDDIRHVLKPAFLREDFTLFDWLRTASTYKISSLPMVEEEEMTFLKLITFDDILHRFENTGLKVESSVVLVIKKPSKEFLYSEVFQVAESNAAKIFGSYINHSDEEETEIVLNIYHVGLNELLQSYRRYDYDIVSYHEEDLHHETLKANSDYFSKYLTV